MQETQTIQKIWQVGECYTVIAISDVLAMTTKSEIKVVDMTGEDPIFRVRDKDSKRLGRKDKIFSNSDRTGRLVFKGWDLALKIDWDQDMTTGSRMCAGNACFNFMGTPEFVKDFINKNNINEYFAEYDHILAHGDKETGETGTPVYPEEPTESKIVQEIRKRFGMDGKSPEVVYSYGRDQAIEDGILTANPRQDVFPECDIITGNLLMTINKFSRDKNKTQELQTDIMDFVGYLMLCAKDRYDSKNFKGDQDKDFFTLDAKGIGIKEVWFVRNESGHLTAMLPEDY